MRCAECLTLPVFGSADPADDCNVLGVTALMGKSRQSASPLGELCDGPVFLRQQRSDAEGRILSDGTNNIQIHIQVQLEVSAAAFAFHAFVISVFVLQS
jgi:hypothetical protein